jgi:hypothetical protein
LAIIDGIVCRNASVLFNVDIAKTPYFGLWNKFNCLLSILSTCFLLVVRLDLFGKEIPMGKRMKIHSIIG